jgi:hypothetical protein
MREFNRPFPKFQNRVTFRREPIEPKKIFLTSGNDSVIDHDSSPSPGIERQRVAGLLWPASVESNYHATTFKPSDRGINIKRTIKVIFVCASTPRERFRKIKSEKPFGAETNKMFQ